MPCQFNPSWQITVKTDKTKFTKYMPDLAQKRSILEPFLGSKKYNTCFIGNFKTKEHAWTKFLS